MSEFQSCNEVDEVEEWFDAVDNLTKKIHEDNVKVGWWDGVDKNPLVVPAKLALVHSEISEALEGFRKNLPDDKLLHHPMVAVELADAMIRIMDLAGFLGVNLGSVMAEKIHYNRTRADHTKEHRQSANGKRF